jgi:hypothetical protein
MLIFANCCYLPSSVLWNLIIHIHVIYLEYNETTQTRQKFFDEFIVTYEKCVMKCETFTIVPQYVVYCVRSCSDSSNVTKRSKSSSTFNAATTTPNSYPVLPATSFYAKNGQFYF